MRIQCPVFVFLLKVQQPFHVPNPKAPTLSRVQNALGKHSQHRHPKKPPSPALVMPPVWWFASPSSETRASDAALAQDMPERFIIGPPRQQQGGGALQRSQEGFKQGQTVPSQAPQPSPSQGCGQLHCCQKAQWPLLPPATLQRPLIGHISTPEHSSWTRTAHALALGHIPGPGEHPLSKGTPR